MSSHLDRTRPYTNLPLLTIYPYHFTQEEAQQKQGIIVRTDVAIFDIPKGTRGEVVHYAENYDGGYSLAIEWRLALDRSHDQEPEAGTDPTPDPLIDWFTKGEYERYLTEIE
jgi:hypothetical protein